MATVTGYTAERMKEIEDSAIVDGDIVGDNLILKRYDGGEINAGNVRGPQGPVGPEGVQDFIICTSGTRPVTPAEGTLIYETDTDKIFAYYSGGWNLPKNVAGGVIGHAKAEANQGGIGGVEVDLTNLSVPINTNASRRILISAVLPNVSSDTSDDTFALSIREGGTLLQNAISTIDVGNQGVSISTWVLIDPPAGAHTYKLTAQRANGSGTLTMFASANNPASILVQDLGGV